MADSTGTTVTPSDPHPTVVEARREVRQAAAGGLHDAAVDHFARRLSSGASVFNDVSVTWHRSKLERALSAAELGRVTLFESGSWTRKTHVPQRSDVDYLALASCERPKTPMMALGFVHDAIIGSDWEIKEVALSPPVVQVSHITGPRFEIAPAWGAGTAKGYDVFHIVGRDLLGPGLQKWIRSAPQAHIDYVDEQDARHSGRVKPLIQLVKSWNYAAGAPMPSFYLELRVAAYAAGLTRIRYAEAVRGFLQHLLDVRVDPMPDPMGLVRPIPAVGSRPARRAVLAAIADTLRALDGVEHDPGQRPDRYWSAMAAVFGADYPLAHTG